MTYRGILTEEAKAELDHEIAYSKERWGAKQATIYKRELLELVRKIVRNPMLYPLNFDLVTSLEQLDELRRASRYAKLKAILQPHLIGAMVNNLQRAIVLERLTTDVEADDPNDVFLLVMAQAGEADYLVTGDRRAGLLQRKSFGKTKIVTPKEFCTYI